VTPPGGPTPEATPETVGFAQQMLAQRDTTSAEVVALPHVQGGRCIGLCSASGKDARVKKSRNPWRQARPAISAIGNALSIQSNDNSER
jgi:hypothetical protein